MTGFDTNADVVAGLSNGSSHIDDLSSTDVLETLQAGVAVTTDPTCISKSAAYWTIILAVPLAVVGLVLDSIARGRLEAKRLAYMFIATTD